MNLKLPCLINGDPKEFVLFVGNFQMNIKPLATFADGSKIQYLRTLVRDKLLRHIDTLSYEVGSPYFRAFKINSFGFGYVFFPVNALSKKSDTP